MTQPISRPMHGVITDYPYVAAVSIAPKFVGFEDEPAAALLCRVLSGTILLSSLLTRAEWGVFRVMPYKWHLVLDFIGGATALTAPWLFGFSKNPKARNTFLIMGLFGLFAAIGSKPEEME